jgi:hypothetical protein
MTPEAARSKPTFGAKAVLQTRLCRTVSCRKRKRARREGAPGGGEYSLNCALPLLCFVLLILPIYGFAEENKAERAFLDADAILAGWRSSYEGLGPMEVSYLRCVVEYEPPADRPDHPPPVRHMYVERVEDGNRYHTRYFESENLLEGPESEYAFDGAVTREYLQGTAEGAIRKGLTGRHTETGNHLKDLMLLNPQRVASYRDEYPNGVPTFVFLFRQLKSSAVIRSDLERVAGELCHVVELPDVGRDYANKSLFWIAHNKGMCLMRYHYYTEDHTRIIDVKEIGEAKMDVGAIWYPVRVSETLTTGQHGSWKVELSVTKFCPKVAVDANTFRFAFPDGTHVVDDLLGVSYTAGVTDVEWLSAADGLQPDVVQIRAEGTPQARPDDVSAEEISESSATTTHKHGAPPQDPNGSSITGTVIPGWTCLLLLGIVTLTSAGWLLLRRGAQRHEGS